VQSLPCAHHAGREIQAAILLSGRKLEGREVARTTGTGRGWVLSGMGTEENFFPSTQEGSRFKPKGVDNADHQEQSGAS
jgi:hypothetical protein